MDPRLINRGFFLHCFLQLIQYLACTPRNEV
jgi:hypothetical protein